jgi:hypothetical protein
MRASATVLTVHRSELSRAGIPQDELPKIEVSPSDKLKPLALFDTGTSTGKHINDYL